MKQRHRIIPQKTDPEKVFPFYITFIKTDPILTPKPLYFTPLLLTKMSNSPDAPISPSNPLLTEENYCDVILMINVRYVNAFKEILISG